MTKPSGPEGWHGFSPAVGHGSEEAVQAGNRAFHPEAAGAPGPGREPSEEERSGVSSTDTEARSPLGVGESGASRRAEEIAKEEQEAGRETVGVKGESGRPYGTSTAEDSTGVGPQDAQGESPTMPSGDQGG
ncbi:MULTISPECIES: hypothetical protein [Nonomuraea]|uniref:Uncharacterized protein n=1 Tax=Nonomuraea mangrovi TaxID=2316207 RepID=A0ABW4TFX7_9ACTN